MAMKRLLRIALLVIPLLGVIYGVKNYHQIDQDDRTLGEWEKSSEKLVSPVLEKMDEGVEYFSRIKVEIPEAGSSGDNKEVIVSNTKEMVDQLVETVKGLPEKQAVKIKEQIIREIFPDCQCSCSNVKDNND